MTAEDSYWKLADHLSKLGMGYPPTETLIEILKENFKPQEAEIALAIPTGVIPLRPVPLNEILKNVSISTEKLSSILDDLSRKGLIFCAKTEHGQEGYALQQVGFSFPQTFFWKGEDTAHSRNMAALIAKYFNKKVTRQAYSAKTLPYRYIPIDRTLEPNIQAVFPHHTMQNVIEKVTDFAVCHCSCRMIAKLRGRPCEHPLEVCIKFDEVAEYVTDRNLGRKISRDEAQAIIKKSEEAGLVHFVDNAEGGIKHNCNCCGCACWNVGVIRRRKIPRDVIMAAYFVRETDKEACSGCGTCVEICPVDAVKIVNDLSFVDSDWCIGCGVCKAMCPNDAIQITLRPDKTGELPATEFTELHEMILMEKDLG